MRPMHTSWRTPGSLLGLSVSVLVAACAIAPGAGPSTAPPSPSPVTSVPGTPDASSQAPTAAPAKPGSVRLCEDVPRIAASPEMYRDDPIYAGNPDAEVEAAQSWASAKPGFEALWIDRTHLGWITLAFSAEPEARQRELERALPDIGAVVVGVEWTRPEMDELEDRISESLQPDVASVATSFDVTKGVVEISLGYLEPDVVALVTERFGSEPICVSGLDPAVAPVNGPQPTAGDGWRLLADEEETGAAYRTGIAFDAASYEQLRRDAGLSGPAAPVDFVSEVAIWFGAVHGSSCPRMRLDDVVVDQRLSIVHGRFTYFELGACTADAVPHAYVVALERSRLPRGPFRIQLGPEGPPAGVPQEVTVVHVQLVTPGSTARPSEITRGEPAHEEPPGPGLVVEPGFVSPYRQSTHCGLEWLGPINHLMWRTGSARGVDWMPVEWRDGVEDDALTLEVLLDDRRQPPVIDATAGGLTVTYEATAAAPPGCD